MKFFSMALSPFFAFLLLPFLSDSCLGLEVDCFFETDIKISCRCFGFDRDTVGQEDLSDILQRYVADYFTNTYLRHVEVRDCGNLDLNINLRAFMVDGLAQNISIVSFENVDDLKLNIQNIDYGDKQFVFKAIRFLTLSGELMHPSTRVTIFVLNDRFYKGEVTFKDFVSQSDIQLINIQDARSVRVTDSAFAEVREIDILRTDFCYADNTVVDCDDINQLFPTSWFTAMLLRNPIYIVLIVLLILLLLLAIFACIYVRHWKKKKELELLGYPASTLSRSTPPPPQHMLPPPGSRLGSIRPNLEADPGALAKDREREMMDPTGLVGRPMSRHAKERY